jgi:hypothetical protein
MVIRSWELYRRSRSYWTDLPCCTGQWWWSRQKGIPWLSRLGVGRGVDALIVEKLLTNAAGRKNLKRRIKIKDLRGGARIVLSLYRSGALLEGTRRVGRPAVWWLDSVEDLKTTGVRNWRRKALDRDQWRAIVKEAKVLHGLQRPQKLKKIRKHIKNVHVFNMYNICMTYFLLRHTLNTNIMAHLRTGYWRSATKNYYFIITF